ncbi:MAG: nucleotide exchange factor GrpE [Candidatus Peribacteria bacterium]|jgi:molecular chaperone GrpE|nr:nucleotide exchange factor GrpE [Candidatus Peribacteria bacterium]
MTKPKNPQDDRELQDILQDLEKKTKEQESEEKTSANVLKEIALLQTQLLEKAEIAKKAQVDYINLKADFDFLVRQSQIKEETLEQDTLIKVVKKLLPFVEDLRKSLLHLNEVQKEEPLGKGVQMVYDKFLSALAELSVFPINTMGIEPDAQFHEPVSMQPTDQKKMKGKILQIFEQGFYYKKGEQPIVILPSKVVIG